MPTYPNPLRVMGTFNRDARTVFVWVHRRPNKDDDEDEGIDASLSAHVPHNIPAKEWAAEDFVVRLVEKSGGGEALAAPIRTMLDAILSKLDNP